jgi:translation elongation factor EF-Tu-like GTPase
MYELIKMKARINLFDAPNGRKTPFVSGYRPLFNFSNAPTKISGKIDLIGKESFLVGMSDDVHITFIMGIIDDDYFKAGVKFSFDEGGDVLGSGEFI